MTPEQISARIYKLFEENKKLREERDHLKSSGLGFAKSASTLAAKLTAVEAERDHLRDEIKFIHWRLNQLKIDRTACGGEGDAEVELSVQDRMRKLESKFAAAEAERERLREAGNRVVASTYLDDDVLNRLSGTTVLCSALKELIAALDWEKNH